MFLAANGVVDIHERPIENINYLGAVNEKILILRWLPHIHIHYYYTKHSESCKCRTVEEPIIQTQ